MATHSSILAWKIPWTEEHSRLQSMGSQRVRHNWATSLLLHEDLQDLLELISKKYVLFIIGDWNAEVASEKIPVATGIFGLGLQNEAGQRLIEFCQENTLVTQTPSSNNTREDSTHGHHQMVNTEIRLIIFFAAKDGEAVYRVSKNKTRSWLWLRSWTPY